MTRKAFLVIPLAALGAWAEKLVSDDEIYDNVRRRLINDPDVKGATLDIEVKEGVVTLRGSVEQEKWRNKAEKLAKKVDGVKQVRNELTVGRRSR